MQEVRSKLLTLGLSDPRPALLTTGLCVLSPSSLKPTFQTTSLTNPWHWPLRFTFIKLNRAGNAIPESSLLHCFLSYSLSLLLPPAAPHPSPSGHLIQKQYLSSLNFQSTALGFSSGHKSQNIIKHYNITLKGGYYLYLGIK